MGGGVIRFFHKVRIKLTVLYDLDSVLKKLKYAWQSFIRLIGWFWEGKLFLLGVGVFVAVITFFCMMPIKPESSIRYSGLVLQVFGLVTVAYEIISKIHVFELPSYWCRFKKWLARCPLVPKKKYVEASFSSGFSISGPDMNFQVWRGSKLEAPLDERIIAIEANLEMLRDSFKSERKYVDGRLTNLSSAVHQESSDRKDADSKINKRVEDLSVEGLHYEVIGLFWLVTGIVLATIPSDVLHLFHFVESFTFSSILSCECEG